MKAAEQRIQDMILREFGLPQTLKSYINPSPSAWDPVGTFPSPSFSIRSGEAVLAMPGVYRFFVTGHRKT